MSLHQVVFGHSKQLWALAVCNDDDLSVSLHQVVFGHSKQLWALAVCNDDDLSVSLHQVVFGHSKQLWALAVCNDDDSYVTAGYDGLVVKWSDQRKVVWRASVRIPNDR